MSSEQNEHPAIAPLCANNCGFYGNPANRNLCSKCYREFLKDENNSQSLTTSISVSPTPTVETTKKDENEKYEGKNSSDIVLTENEQTPSKKNNDNDDEKEKKEISGDVSEKINENDESDNIATNNCEKKKKNTCHDTITIDDKNKKATDTDNMNNEKDVPESKPVTEKPQVNKNRCFFCNKKIGLLGFECKCNYVYCCEHRYPDTHNCNFDFKTFDRKQLSKHHNKVIASKIEKI